MMPYPTVTHTAALRVHKQVGSRCIDTTAHVGDLVHVIGTAPLCIAEFLYDYSYLARV